MIFDNHFRPNHHDSSSFVRCMRAGHVLLSLYVNKMIINGDDCDDIESYYWWLWLIRLFDCIGHSQIWLVVSLSHYIPLYYDNKNAIYIACSIFIIFIRTLNKLRSIAMLLTIICYKALSYYLMLLLSFILMIFSEILTRFHDFTFYLKNSQKLLLQYHEFEVILTYIFKNNKLREF